MELCRSWSIVQQYGAQLHVEKMLIHTLNYLVELSGVLFSLAGGVSECNLSHRRSEAVLCMIFKIKGTVPAENIFFYYTF